MYTIAQAKKSVANGIRGYLLKDDQGQYVMEECNRLPFYLEGEPGIGKTEIVRQIAKEMGIGYVSFSLTHHTRNSLLGLPVIKELENGDKYTCYTISEIIAKVFQAVEQGYKEGILLLDEFPCMSETIMPAMLAFLQTKNIGTYHLPEGWVIVLCGNPVQYNRYSKIFDAAIMDRVRRLEIHFEPDVFVQYGRSIGLHPCILEYLRIHPNRVYLYHKTSDGMELVTCRGWENLSHMLKSYEILGQPIEADDIKQYLKSEESASSFFQYYKQYCGGITKSDVDNILKGIRIPYYVNEVRNKNYNMKWNCIQSLLGAFRLNNSKYFKQKKEVDYSLYDELKDFISQKEREISSDEVMTYMISSGQMISKTMISKTCKILRQSQEAKKYNALLTKWWAWGSAVSRKINPEDTPFQNVMRLYEVWGRDRKTAFDDMKQKASEMLDNLMSFTEKIDTEHTISEMLFCTINDDKDILALLLDCPNEQYLKECSKRYADTLIS